MTVVSTHVDMDPYQEIEKRERILSYIYSVMNICRHGPLTGDMEKGWFEGSIISTECLARDYHTYR